MAKRVSSKQLKLMNAYWRAANYGCCTSWDWVRRRIPRRNARTRRGEQPTGDPCAAGVRGRQPARLGTLWTALLGLDGK